MGSLCRAREELVELGEVLGRMDRRGKQQTRETASGSGAGWRPGMAPACGRS